MFSLAYRGGAHRGQSAVEYALLLSILAFVFLTMFFYVKNAVRARLMITQDRLNEVRTQ
jgi:Flp pilus assembly pilin Flp